MPSNIDELIAHWEFLAELSYETPLDDLLRDGDVSSTKPANPDCRHGTWLPVYKTPEQLGIKVRGRPEHPEPPRRTRPFTFGPLPVDGGPWKPWFIDVRRVIESGARPEDKADAIEALRNCDRHAAIRLRIPKGVGLTLAMAPLVQIDGVSSELADGLWAAGLKTSDAVFAATDGELLAIRGLGAARLRRIRAEQARRHRAPRPPTKQGSRPS